MDKQVNVVVKSKSSNSAVYTKTDKGNKKSRSNAEFQPNVLKKRGMYVEKKDTRASIDDPAKSPSKRKAPPRPRPGSKKFLSSVLTILSKSTTGTQHPELNYPKEASIEKRAKRKFKSRILNDKPDDKLIVLQTKKDIYNTPSIYSERSQDTSKTNSRFAKNNLVNDIEGVKRQRKDKKVIIDDPPTLVQDKKDPELYNFFVDLLQTTFSNCNVKDQYIEERAILKKPSISKVELVINESVAKKLNVIDDNETKLSGKNSTLCCMIDDNWSDLTVTARSPSPLKYSKIDLLPKQKYTKPRKIESFNNKIMLPKVYSGLFPTKKSYTAKNKKKIVLTLLKQQLKMDADYEEPQNLYESLRNIARNKRKCQKTIRFTNNDSGDECIFKQKRVISTSKSKRRIDRSKSARTDFNYERKIVKDYSRETSFHSLEVYDYDYEVNRKRRRAKKTFYAPPSITTLGYFPGINDDFEVSDEFY